MVESLPKEFSTSAGSLMLRVAAGSFTMGSPDSEEGHRVWERQREVTFTEDFYVGQTPVTQSQYEAVTGLNPTDHARVAAAPIDSVNWHQANEFCEELTERDRKSGTLPAGWKYRLPTEAEWEYVCRAGGAEPRHGSLEAVAWHHPNASGSPQVVGRKEPNAWGFHDTLGNIWEWCQDWFYRANPSRAARGGSYFNSARFCRAAQRWGWNPNSRGRYSGFRLLASSTGSFNIGPPIDDYARETRPPSIYTAIDAEDVQLAQQVLDADPTSVNCTDLVPPPLHCCIYQEKLTMLEWLLDHGADIELREQDYGATPLDTAVVMRRKSMIQALVKRGADASRAADLARRGLAGEFEDDPTLDRAGYQEIVDLLTEL